MKGVISMSYTQALTYLLGALVLALSAIAGVAAKDDNQQQLAPLPATSRNFQPAMARTLNKMLAQHLCRASGQLTVRCIYHDHYNIPDTEADLASSGAETIIPD